MWQGAHLADGIKAAVKSGLPRGHRRRIAGLGAVKLSSHFWPPVRTAGGRADGRFLQIKLSLRYREELTDYVSRVAEYAVYEGCAAWGGRSTNSRGGMGSFEKRNANRASRQSAHYGLVDIGKIFYSRKAVN